MPLKNENQTTRESAGRAQGPTPYLGRLEDDKSHYAVTIGAAPDQVYAFFRNFANLPLFMKDLKEVRVLSERKSHWVVEIKRGNQVEWDAEIVREKPGEMISWKSLDGSEVETSGTIWFRPAPEGRGTVVSLTLDYHVPGGKLTEWLTKMTGEDPDSLSFTNLRRLKAYLETGEVPTTHGQPSGRDDDAEVIDDQPINEETITRH